jgi:hypothetical protein
MILRHARNLLLPILLSLSPGTALGIPRLDLSERIVIDGFSGEFDPDEHLFQPRPGGGLEERTTDSQWGQFNDINQIKLTWDANFVYVAVDGYIFDNNAMIFFDTLEPEGANQGLEGLSQVNSWRRAVSFDNGIFPELFLATWDSNTIPQVWQYTGPNQVSQVPQGSFPTVASFSRDLAGRSMEAAIPWNVFFLGEGEMEFDPAYGDTVYKLPEFDPVIRICAWITTGADGLGGPDSAPDNLGGHQADAAVPVILDNFIRLRIDRYDAAGNPEPDGVPDFGHAVRVPTTEDLTEEEYRAVVSDFFLAPPPIRGTSVQFARLDVVPGVFAPDLGETIGFRFQVGPEIDPSLQDVRKLEFTAQVFNIQGTRVRTIYTGEAFTQADLDLPGPLPRNRFDGRDDNGNLVEGGIYVLRLVLDPDRDQIERAFMVAR